MEQNTRAVCSSKSSLLVVLYSLRAKTRMFAPFMLVSDTDQELAK